jgi:hypothetical protein
VVSYGAEVYPQVIAASCTSGCHSTGQSATGPVVMSTVDAGYANSVDQPSISYADLDVVSPGNPKTSVLYLKLLGGTPAGYRGPGEAPVGGKMPPTGSTTAAQKELVRRWICAGAEP